MLLFWFMWEIQVLLPLLPPPLAPSLLQSKKNSQWEKYYFHFSLDSGVGLKELKLLEK